ncbi:MAG: GNAT family N-acetyltransferase [Robiginitomaculum sp.]|nr:GNAT family N-acetyltransferase [Robiginitomaculum sp.]
MAKVQIIQATSPAQIADVKYLFWEYIETLKTEFGNDIGCADGHADMQNFPGNYKALLLASLDGVPVAACGVKRVNGQDCELVRLYCRPEGRGHGLGRKLSQTARDYVKADGCKRLGLSTEPAMKHAVKLYKLMGFSDIENYADAPSACSKYMALEL